MLRQRSVCRSVAAKRTAWSVIVDHGRWWSRRTLSGVSLWAVITLQTLYRKIGVESRACNKGCFGTNKSTQKRVHRTNNFQDGSFTCRGFLLHYCNYKPANIVFIAVSFHYKILYDRPRPQVRLRIRQTLRHEEVDKWPSSMACLPGRKWEKTFRSWWRSRPSRVVTSCYDVGWNENLAQSTGNPVLCKNIISIIIIIIIIITGLIFITFYSTYFRYNNLFFLLCSFLRTFLRYTASVNRLRVIRLTL